MDEDGCGCLICTGTLPGTDAKLLSTVHRHGWSALSVPAGVDFAYTGGWRLLGDRFPLPGEADNWALTTRAVLDGTRDPALVLFDEDVFDVLDERGHDADDLCVTHLGAIVRRHPSLGTLGDLRQGTAAGRTPGGGWRRAALTAGQRDASAAGWERGQQTRVVV